MSSLRRFGELALDHTKRTPQRARAVSDSNDNGVRLIDDDDDDDDDSSDSTAKAIRITTPIRGTLT